MRGRRIGRVPEQRAIDARDPELRHQQAVAALYQHAGRHQRFFQRLCQDASGDRQAPAENVGDRPREPPVRPGYYPLMGSRRRSDKIIAGSTEPPKDVEQVRPVRSPAPAAKLLIDFSRLRVSFNMC